MTEFGDIDVFVQDDFLPNFVEKLKQANPSMHLQKYGPEPNPDYPEDFEVYNLWINSKKTIIQAIS